MNHFHYKSLAFYGVAISSVLLLFKVVTLYGEKHLQPAPTISDRYRLMLAENLPNCEKPTDLILNIQQSGIYINASLLPANSNIKPATNHHQNSLTGILKHQQLNLSGHINTAILCQIIPTQNTLANSTTLQMQFQNPKTPTGQININGVPQSLQFNAFPQIPESSSNTH
ncbi:hypothetical protein [Fortiea contorta]|uniref:hypothetical protein n=1 Tax=Fortiea contorta TaxID=1892405 RepID=UPI00034D83E5|nr:hypothetical protein [Fortiea contorta]